MSPYYEDDAVTLYHGDCRDVLANMAAESVAAVLTDPPYTERIDERYCEVIAKRLTQDTLFGEVSA